MISPFTHPRHERAPPYWCWERGEAALLQEQRHLRLIERMERLYKAMRSADKRP